MIRLGLRTIRFAGLIDSPAFARELADLVDAYVGQPAWREAARGQWQVQNAAAVIGF